MRFVCDHDVDARVASRLRHLGHDAWTAAEARLGAAHDDDLTVYAHNQGAVLISHDKKFSERRRRHVIGRHIFLRCREWEAADLLERHMDDIVSILSRYQDAWVKLSAEGHPTLSFDWQ